MTGVMHPECGDGRVRCVVPAGDLCGEGLTWSAGERALYWTDVNRFLVHRHDLGGGGTRSWHFEEPVVALSLTSRAGCLLVALASRLLLWWPGDDRREAHGFSLDGSPSVRLNDGRAGPDGRFWIGSMKNNVLPDGAVGEVGEGAGKLFRVGKDGVTILCEGIGVANTLCWSPDRTRFYFADTLANSIRLFDYDEGSGSISDGRPLLPGFDRGLPDGSAMDAEGHLWNCRYGGGCIVRVAPDGTVERVVDMPVANVTTCAFGGDDLRTLFVTTASAGRWSHRLAGSLFSLVPGCRGLPEDVVDL